MHDRPAGQRTRTIVWDDPAPALRALGTISGRDYLQGMVDGRFPRAPISELIGMTSMTFDADACRLEVALDESHTNPVGTVHGGVIATILDSAIGCAVQASLPPGRAYTTVSLETKFLRPVDHRDARLVCTAAIVHKGQSIVTGEARLENSRGKLVATATSTLALFDPGARA